MKSKKKLPLLARIFGNRRRIVFIDNLPSDEVVYSGYRIYMPANSILFNKGERNEKNTN